MKCCVGESSVDIITLGSVPSLPAAASVTAATTVAIIIDGGIGFHTSLRIEENNVLDDHSNP
jgi:hypothetical protein